MSWSDHRQQGWVTADRIGRGLTIDPESGLLEPRLAGALTFTPDGEIYLNTGPEIIQAPASPTKASIPTLPRTHAMAVSASDAADAARVLAVAAVASAATRASAADLTTLQGQVTTLAASLATAQADIVTLQAAVPIARGFATLVIGTKAVAVAAIQAGAVVQYTPKTLLGTVGALSYTVTAGVGFTINSVSALDVSVIGYVVWNP